MKVCNWSKDADGVHETTCGHAFVFNEDGIDENGFMWCPYCGEAIEELKAEE